MPPSSLSSTSVVRHRFNTSRSLVVGSRLLVGQQDANLRRRGGVGDGGKAYVPYLDRVAFARNKLPDPVWVTAVECLLATLAIGALLLAVGRPMVIRDTVIHLCARLGHVGAQNALGENALHHLSAIGDTDGDQVNQKLEGHLHDALYWLERAALNGDVTALYNILLLVHSSSSSSLLRRISSKLLGRMDEKDRVKLQGLVNKVLDADDNDEVHEQLRHLLKQCRRRRRQQNESLDVLVDGVDNNKICTYLN